MAALRSFNVSLPKVLTCTSLQMSLPGHYHNQDRGIDSYPQMSFAYATGTAINWGNEACTPTFTATFSLNHILMIWHKRRLLLMDGQQGCHVKRHVPDGFNLTLVNVWLYQNGPSEDGASFSEMA